MLEYSVLIVPSLIVILLILSSVGLGSVNNIEAGKPADKTHLDNTRRSLQGLVTISVIIIAYYVYTIISLYNLMTRK